jgi:hypothetical protein
LTTEANYSSTYKEVFISILNTLDNFNDINNLKYLFKKCYKINTPEIIQAVNQKTKEILEKIRNNKVDDPPPEDSLMSIIINCNDYKELTSLYKQHFEEINNDKELKIAYDFKKNEILYERASKIFTESKDKATIEDVWIKCNQHITEKILLDSLKILYQKAIQS